MPRKTLALIVGLVLVTLILFIIALRTDQEGGKKEVSMTATPTPVAHSVLTLSPNPVAVVAGKQGEISVMLDPSINKVTTVQLELKYDPLVVSNIKVVPGPLFTNSIELLNNNNIKTGHVTYAIGILPNQEPISGVGTVATITFTARGALGKQSQILLEPSSLVTAQGVTTSVLKSATGTTIVIGSATTTTEMIQPKATTIITPVVSKAPVQ